MGAHFGCQKTVGRHFDDCVHHQNDALTFKPTDLKSYIFILNVFKNKPLKNICYWNNDHCNLC